MTTLDILRAVEAVGGRIDLLDGERLRIGAPPGRLTPDLLAMLREHKADIVVALKAKQSFPGRDPLATDPHARTVPPPGNLWKIFHKLPEPVAMTEPSPPRPDPWVEVEKLPLMDGDRAHIKKHLRGRSRADQAQLLVGYVERWRMAADAEPISFRKPNAGRRTANIWMRSTT